MENKLPALQSTVLDDEQLSRHRAFVAIKAQSLMSRYFQLPQDELVKRDILLGWMDALQDYTQEEINNACRSYLINFPNRRPHEGHILEQIIKARDHVLKRQPRLQIEEKSKREQDPEKRRKISEELMRSFTKKMV